MAKSRLKNPWPDVVAGPVIVRGAGPAALQGSGRSHALKWPYTTSLRHVLPLIPQSRTTTDYPKASPLPVVQDQRQVDAAYFLLSQDGKDREVVHLRRDRAVLGVD